MTNTPLTFEADLVGLEGDEWIDRLEDLAEDFGYFEPLGPDHQAVFLQGGSNLLVTFEDAETICKTPLAEPRSFEFARSEGWSILTIIARTESWFRHPAIYQFFDGLVDEGTLEEFDNVVFFGTNGAGYAAAAYSVTAPGARVLAIRPQATLDPRITDWDHRHIAQRRRDFTTRYGYAPDMLDAADEAFVLFSPSQKADAIHGALFTRPNVTKLRANGLNGRVEVSLDAIGILDDLIRETMAGTLNAMRFAQLMKAAKDYSLYQRLLVKRAIEAGHPKLAANLAALLSEKTDDAYFAQKLDELAKDGIHPGSTTAITAAQ